MFFSTRVLQIFVRDPNLLLSFDGSLLKGQTVAIFVLFCPFSAHPRLSCLQTLILDLSHGFLEGLVIKQQKRSLLCMRRVSVTEVRYLPLQR